MVGDGLVVKDDADDGRGVSVISVSFIDREGLLFGLTEDDPFGGSSMAGQTTLSGPTCIPGD